MKRNISLIMVFLFGCATAKMVEYVSFQDAVAKTGKRCHYTRAAWRGIQGEDGEVKYREATNKLIKKGWKMKFSDPSIGVITWEKCK